MEQIRDVNILKMQLIFRLYHYHLEMGEYFQINNEILEYHQKKKCLYSRICQSATHDSIIRCEFCDNLVSVDVLSDIDSQFRLLPIDIY